MTQEHRPTKSGKTFAVKAALYGVFTVAIAAVFAQTGGHTPPLQPAPAQTIAFTAPYEFLRDDVAKTRGTLRELRARDGAVAGAVSVSYDGPSEDDFALTVQAIALRALRVDPGLQGAAETVVIALGDVEFAPSAQERSDAYWRLDEALDELSRQALERANAAPAAQRVG